MYTCKNARLGEERCRSVFRLGIHDENLVVIVIGLRVVLAAGIDSGASAVNAGRLLHWWYVVYTWYYLIRRRSSCSVENHWCSGYAQKILINRRTENIREKEYSLVYSYIINLFCYGFVEFNERYFVYQTL